MTDIEGWATDKAKVHFSGIGGTAMAAGARLAVEAGWEVRGSDGVLYPPTSHMVAELGVPVYSSYEASNLDWQPDRVIIGNALSRGNPEVEATLSRHLHYMSLPEWLKENVLRQRCPVVVAGTHGKTTTSALTAHLLSRGLSGVGYLVGGDLLDFPYSSHLGQEGAAFVIEGDEYDTAFFDKRAKFLHYLPHIAVVTSMEFDHGDIYRDLAEIETAFERLLRQIPQEGLLLACADNAAEKLKDKAFCSVETYGFSEGADWRGIVFPGDPLRLEIWRKGVRWGELRSALSGRHNMQNLLAAAAIASRLDVPVSRITEAAADFKGVRRRMEVFHDCGGVLFVDDFAHHPTAIRETIAAARMRWPGRRVRVVFEPRSNTTVTNRFQTELEQALAGGDDVFVGPIYRKAHIPASERLDVEALVRHMGDIGASACYEENIPVLVERIMTSSQAGDIVLVMSNGAFGGIYQLFREAGAS